MADKQVTVAVPEERVPEFYVWFASFLAADQGGPVPWGGPIGPGGPPWAGAMHEGGPGGGPPWAGGMHEGGPGGGPPWAAGMRDVGPGGRGRGPGRGRGGRGGRGSHEEHEAAGWTADDADQAAWLYGKLAPPARELLDLLIDAPGQRFSGNDIAARLRLDKGAHGVAGILAWPGRYSRKLGRELPIATEGRDDGGTDYYLDAGTATLFAAARSSQTG